MRDIKFRAWDKKKKEWYGESCDEMLTFKDFHLFGECMAFQFPNIDYLQHLEVMQYTGLKDKNGVEIYEGDIVSGHIFGICEVRYYKNAFVLWSVDKDFSRSYACELIEVIGNIYENPELISG